MSYFSAKQLCFPPIAGQTIRADFEGGALSSDFGALLLRGIDRQIGLTERFAAAIHDKRHQSYIDHPLRDLLAQRIYQIASGYADGNDANSLRRDPLFKLSMERSPLDPEHDLASAPTFSRLEHSVDRKDLYRLTQALVDHFIASDPEPPAAIVLDVDHSDDPTHGQQEFTFYNHYYKNYCYLPLFIFEGTSHALVMAYLRPGTRPTGAENAMILSRLLSYLRRYWPQTHILVRGDSHFATPEVIEVIAHRRLTDFVFGLAGNAVLLRQAAPLMQEARQLHQQRTALAHAHGPRPAPACMRRASMARRPGPKRGAWCSRPKSCLRAITHALWSPRCRPPRRRCSMRISTVPAAIAKMISRPSNATCTATAPPRRRSSPTLCGSSWPVPRMCSTMPCVRTRCTTRRSPPPNPRPSL